MGKGEKIPRAAMYAAADFFADLCDAGISCNTNFTANTGAFIRFLASFAAFIHASPERFSEINRRPACR